MKNRMGKFYTNCRVENHVDRKKSAVVAKLPVDTGAQFTWIKAETLRKIGVKPEKKDCTFDMARARKFYEDILGLKPTMVVGEPGGMQWTEYDIANGTLSIGAGAPDWQPRPDGCSVGLEMEDFDTAIAELRAKGVKFKIEPFPTPACRMAFISDPDGNTICIHKRHAK